MNIRKSTLILFLSLGLIAPVAAQTPPDEITLNLRVRDAKTGQVVIKPLKIDPRKVGIVIVDPWNYHWCITYTHRLLATVPRMDRSLQCARRLGMTVMWAPTEAASQYAGYPQRERAAAVPLVEVPRVRSLQCEFAPRQGACTCGPGVACEANYGLDGICSQLAIEVDDLIVSNLQETYSLCKQRGLTHILFMGWATNICLFGRPEGIESMYATGLECYLARDLTDAYDHYDPAVPLTCDDATTAAVVQLEKAGIATFDMVEEMRKAGQWNDAWTVECVRITPWGAADRPYLFERQVVVTLTCPLLADTRIRYTLDGQEPTADSTLYEKPFALAGSMTLRAAAFRADRKVSLTSVGRFVRLGAMPPRPDVYLDQVVPITETYPYWYSSWHPVTDKSFENKPLLLRGKRYEKGLGMRAPCNMRYPLKPEYDRFVALAGIDGNLIQADKERYGIFPGGQGRRTGGGGGMGCLMAQQPHVQFRVFIDGNLAAESPLLRIGQEPWRFDVPIPANARQINLTATDGGQRSLINYADWVEAGFVKKSPKPAKEAVLPWREPVDADYRHASAEAYERFRDWKFGLRIYFWVSAQIEAENGSWVLYDHDADFQAQYHQLYKTFNPQEFNAEEWTDLMVRSGLKYFTFCTKHHDGFSLWDTQTRVKQRFVLTGPRAGQIEDCDLAYSIMDTPFKRDVTKELVEAARRRNLGIGLYYSHWDWYDADFRWSGIGKVLYELMTRESDPAGYARFIARHRGQIAELLSRYGKIDLLEFDCEPAGTYQPYRERGIEDWSRYWPDIKETV